MFIVFDGIDGSGKSTQLALTSKWLAARGRQVHCLADPGSTSLGQELRRLLLGKHSLKISVTSEMLMFMAARAQLVEEAIRPALDRGEVVLCDRFSFSTAVYQGHAGNVDVEKIWRVDQVATRGLIPDLTLIFDLEASVALTRVGKSTDRIESRGPDYFDRVRQGFLKESKRWPQGVTVIDANRGPELVFADVRRVLDDKLSGEWV